VSDRVIKTGLRLLWGSEPLPAGLSLPGGFVLERADCAFAKAVGPDGKRHLVALDPPRLAPETSPGSGRYDFSAAVALPARASDTEGLP